MLHQPGYVVDGELLLSAMVTAVPTQPGSDSCQCAHGDAAGDDDSPEESSVLRKLWAPASVGPPGFLEHVLAAPAAPAPPPPEELQLEQAAASADADANAATASAAAGSPPPKRACTPAAAVGPLGSQPRLLSTLFLRCASVLPLWSLGRSPCAGDPGSTHLRPSSTLPEPCATCIAAVHLPTLPRRMGYLSADSQLWGKHGFDSKRLPHRNQSMAGAMFAAATGPMATQRLLAGQQRQQQEGAAAAAAKDAEGAEGEGGEAEAWDLPHPLATLMELVACALVSAGALAGESSRLTKSGISCPPC